MTKQLNKLKNSLLITLAIVTPVSASVMDVFAGLPAGTLAGLYNTTNGAAIKHAFPQMQAGDVISFDWNYRAGDYPEFRDTSWVSANGGTPKILAWTSNSSPGGGGLNVPAAGNTGWQHFEWNVTPTEALLSTFNMTIGVNNTSDLIFPAWIGVDNFAVNGNNVFNGGFETGSLFGFSGVGDVVALQDANTIAYNDSVYNYDPASGDWFALLFSQGAPSQGTGGLGGSPGTAVLPATDPNNPFSWTFDALASGAWMDPPFVNGFIYENTTPGSLFTSINFPMGPLYSVFSGLSISAAGCDTPGTFGNGGGDNSSFSFAACGGGGVSQFTLSSSSPLFDAGDSAGFPLQTFFNTSTANVTMSALNPPALPSSSVPEPGTLALMGTGLLGALLLRRKSA